MLVKCRGKGRRGRKPGPAQRASSVHPVGRRPTAVDSRGTAPRCPQLSTALPCRVSVRWSREDQRAPGVRCSVMTCGLLISRVARSGASAVRSGVPPPCSRAYTLWIVVFVQDPAGARAEPDCPALPRPPRRRRKNTESSRKEMSVLESAFLLRQDSRCLSFSSKRIQMYV